MAQKLCTTCKFENHPIFADPCYGCSQIDRNNYEPKQKKQKNDPNGITPQSFETNDCRWIIEIEDEDLLVLKNYEDGESIEMIFECKDLDVLINLLTKAKEINTKAWKKEV